MSGAEKASPGVSYETAGPLDPSRALVPRVVRLNERLVARGFWPKLRKVAAHAPFAAEALAVWYCVQDPETPAPAKGMMLAALAYFVLPADAVPDFIAGLGYTDDAAVFAAMMALVGRHVRPRHRDAAKAAIDRIRAQA
jgi:uncharacterized membrane protein YkvA (DUF1232 family)